MNRVQFSKECSRGGGGQARGKMFSSGGWRGANTYVWPILLKRGRSVPVVINNINVTDIGINDKLVSFSLNRSAIEKEPFSFF
jgi:hypothetical protein